jgi:hypothetical protein
VPDIILASPERAQVVKTRLLAINSQASNLIIENGLLLKEYKQNDYYKADGFATFDVAIQMMQESGQLDYGPRQARNFIAIVDMLQALGIDPADVETIGISKLREIASLPLDTDQRALLSAARTLTVAEVQREAKRLRDKAFGRETDPLVPVVLKTTETQATFLKECLTEARRIYALPDTLGDASVFVDSILAEWFTNKDTYEAEQLQAGQL